jgi:hypothetical protein
MGGAFFRTLPGPAPFDFKLQCHAEERSDQDDKPEDHYVLQRWCYNDRPDNIARDKELQAEQDGPAQILPVKSVGFAGFRMSINDKTTRGKDRAGDDHKDPYCVNRPADTVHYFTIVNHHIFHGSFDLPVHSIASYIPVWFNDYSHQLERGGENIQMLHCLSCEMRDVLFRDLLCLDNQNSATCMADDLFR